MPHSLTNLLYHIVFATKEREPCLAAPWRAELHAVMGGIIREYGGAAFGIGGIEDHVHILARLRADRAVADVVRAIKSRSSSWVRRSRPDLGHFQWQAGYSAFTVSQSQAGRVQRYITDQEAAHRERGYSAEIRRLLRANGLCETEPAAAD